MDRQKIGLIFGGAAVLAALLTWVLYANTVAPRKDKMASIVAASRDMPAGTRVGKSDVRMVTVLEREVPRLALTDGKVAENRVLLFPVTTNEPLTSTKISTANGAEGLASTIDPGKRAISVQINDQSGVAGLIQPRSKVDVLFTRPGNMTEALTSTILEDITVLSIGRTTEVQTTVDPKTGATTSVAPGGTTTQNRAATLLLSPDESRKLELAKNQGKISLALRNPLDRSHSEQLQTTTGESIDPYAFMRDRKKGRFIPRPGVNINDPKAWASLIGDDEPKKVIEKPPPPPKPEPPKPRAIVDVFRGEKHVQEIFHD